MAARKPKWKSRINNDMATQAYKKGKHLGYPVRSGFGEAAWALLRVVLAFVAVTSAVVLSGLAYYAIRRRGFGPGSVAWLFPLSREQLVALGFGVIVAFSLVGLVWMALTRRGAPPGGLVRKAAALLVLVLYLWGAYCAYHVSSALNRSPRWASIHCLYSWPYVGFSFAEWATNHPNQPLGKTLRQFRWLMGP
jgi:hypothetical protein